MEENHPRSDPTTERIELDHVMAVALHNWLITVSQRLGLDPETVTEAPTPPTTVLPAAIVTLSGELALRLDASCASAPDTVTVRVHAVPSPRLGRSVGFHAVYGVEEVTS